MRKIILRICLVALPAVFAACASMSQFQAMTPEDRAAYIAYADKLTVEQRKIYLAKGTPEARIAYLQELGLYEEYAQKTAFARLEEEKKHDFLKAYLHATPQQLKQMLAVYDEDTRDRITRKDLQHGWKKEEVILSLGIPNDILEAKTVRGTTNQLWIYEKEAVATYIYFQNGTLTNWAK